MNKKKVFHHLSERTVRAIRRRSFEVLSEVNTAPLKGKKLKQIC